MQTYTCPTCGEKMERNLSLFMDHTEKHIVDEVRKQNPAWVTKEGFCHKCLEYFKNQIHHSGKMPEGTNLDPGGVRQRLVLGVFGYAAGIGAFLWLHANQPAKPAWLILFPIFFMGTLGFLQAKRKLCVVIAQKQEEVMKQKARSILIFSLVLAASLTAGLMVAGLAHADTAIAVIQATTPDSKVSGSVELTDTPEGLKISGNFQNLTPGKHGFHIHENGACGEAGKAAGGHYNPGKVDHGLLSKDGFAHAHAGDFGNVEIGADGTGKFQAVEKGLTLKGGEHSVAGKAFILHEKEDDFGQPTGNAGGRIGCGIIEVTE